MNIVSRQFMLFKSAVFSSVFFVKESGITNVVGNKPGKVLAYHRIFFTLMNCRHLFALSINFMPCRGEGLHNCGMSGPAKETGRL